MDAANDDFMDHKHLITADDLKSLPPITEKPDTKIIDFQNMIILYTRLCSMFGIGSCQVYDSTLIEMWDKVAETYIESKLGPVDINNSEEFTKFLEYLNMFHFSMNDDEENKLYKSFPSLESWDDTVY